jgi:hypothetical protein
VEVRLADVDVAASFEPRDRLGGPGRDVIGEDGRAVGRRQPSGVEQILDRERNACRRQRLRPGEEDAVGIYENSR